MFYNTTSATTAWRHNYARILFTISRAAVIEHVSAVVSSLSLRSTQIAIFTLIFVNLRAFVDPHGVETPVDVEYKCVQHAVHRPTAMHYGNAMSTLTNTRTSIIFTLLLGSPAAHRIPGIK